ncbi:MAG: Alcohol dehydrogenase zinc-binding domain protein, partial [Pedosphaera sp.]|nr:Alcohol dehydrogenase zinc-binding domain protein [Pedosphaera sp.]
MNMYKDDIAMPEPAQLPKSRRNHRQRARGRAQQSQKDLMKAAAIDRFGPPSVLKLHILPVPEPGPDEVLIALHSAGVGVWDAEMRGGWWPEKRPKFPLVLGTDGAGTIAATGARVRRFRAGEAVWAYEFMNRKGGFYAEYVAVNAEHVGRVPKRLDLVHAGGAAVTGLTALQGIDDHLRVRRGETVLIFGASGAVGTLAVQFARRLGARVLGTASGRKAMMLVRRLGAQGVFDARGKRATEELRALAPKGIDAVLALAGGETLERCLDLVRPGGRVVYPNGVEPEPRRRPKFKFTSYDGKGGR